MRRFPIVVLCGCKEMQCTGGWRASDRVGRHVVDEEAVVGKQGGWESLAPEALANHVDVCSVVGSLLVRGSPLRQQPIHPKPTAPSTGSFLIMPSHIRCYVE